MKDYIIQIEIILYEGLHHSHKDVSLPGGYSSNTHCIRMFHHLCVHEFPLHLLNFLLCCSALQCDAVCCSVLQSAAGCCSELQ